MSCSPHHFKKVFCVLVYFLAVAFLLIESCKRIEDELEVKIVTESIDNTGYRYCVVLGKVVDLGGGKLEQHGFCYGESENPTVDGLSTELGSISSTGTYTDSIIGLEPGTRYYFRAYGESSGQVFYGDPLHTTTRSPGVPTVTTRAASEVTGTTVISGGEVTDGGGSEVIARGVCWDVSDSPTIDASCTTDGTGKGSFVSEVTGMSCNTTYYIRAYGTNETGTGYGQSVEITTLECALATPTVITSEIGNVTKTTAQCGGEVTDNGGADITARGICYSTSLGPTIYGDYTTEPGGVGIFTSLLEGLECGTVYYVRAYATNSEGTSYGTQKSFATEACESSVPTVITSPVTAIGETTALSGGTITDNGGSAVTSRGICWSTSPEPDVSDFITNDGGGTGSFISQMKGLTCNTTYYLRAYATNNAGTAYGTEKQFTTGNCSGGLPEVTTTAISGITETTAEGGGNVTSEGGSSVTVRGVCWSTSENPTSSDNHTEDGSGAGTYTSSITGLACSTTYYARAYATNASGTAYGEEVEFRTGSCPAGIPVVSTFTISSITGSSAQGGGNVTDDMGDAVTARGVCWSTSHDPEITDSHTTDGSGRGTFTSLLTGLDCSTTYYVRAYATNSAGTGYGAEEGFTTTGCMPVVMTSSITNITENSATGGGNVTDDGGNTVTARGVCWNTSHDPTLDDYHTEDGSGEGGFTSQLTNLTCNTTYFVRAYATSSAGTSYGGEEEFTTDNCPPGMPAVTTSSISNITSSSATGGGNVTSDGGGTVTDRGICWSTSSNPTTSDLSLIHI